MSPRETERLIQDLLDQTISERDFVRLEEELSLNEEARIIFREHSFLQSQLGDRSIPQPLLSRENLLEKVQRKTVKMSFALAAGIIALASLSLYFISISHPESELTFLLAPDSRFSVTPSSTDEKPTNDSLSVGDSLELSQGTIQLDFGSGVRGIISAPASLTLIAHDKLNLHEGKAWFLVPEEGHGFQVQTGGLLLTDHGTEFGVIHVPGSTDEIHVIDGKVHARALSGLKEEEMLHKGEARVVDVRGSLKAPPILAAPFSKQLPTKLPHLHFPFDGINGNQTPIQGEHSGLARLNALLVQSDDRSPIQRLIDGRHGNAISFDGQGDLVNTNWPGLFGAQPITVAFWIKPTGNPNYAGIVGWGASKSNAEINQQWKLVLNPPGPKDRIRRFRCAWGNDGASGVPVNLEPDQWHHLAVVYTGDAHNETPTLKFYVNGEKQASGNPKVPDPPRRPADLSEALPLTFGHPLDWRKGNWEFSRNFFRGALDEVFIVEGALTDRQIDTIYRKNVYVP